jgi:hypothetical protein
VTYKALQGKRKNNLKVAHQKAFFGQNSGDQVQGNGKVATPLRETKIWSKKGN